MKLSVLIPSTPERREMAHNLASKMAELIGGVWLIGDGKQKWNDVWVSVHRRLNKHQQVEIFIVEDEKELTLGKKRELMYSRLPQGKYSVQIDSDDDIHPDFFKDVFAAMEADPDVITYEEFCDMDGAIRRSNHSTKYTEWAENLDGFDYVRTPFYKDVIKTKIAAAVSFPDIRFNEDEQWSKKILPLLRVEAHIPKQLYRYIYRTEQNNLNRYGQ